MGNSPASDVFSYAFNLLRLKKQYINEIWQVWPVKFHDLALLVSFPSANEVCEGYVFTGVCLSTRGGVCPIACWDTHTPGICWDTHPLGRHPHGQTPPLGRHPTCAVHAWIRSTSRRYASYWNVFLLRILFEEYLGKSILSGVLEDWFFCMFLFIYRTSSVELICNHHIHSKFSLLRSDISQESENYHFTLTTR